MYLLSFRLRADQAGRLYDYLDSLPEPPFSALSLTQSEAQNPKQAEEVLALYLPDLPAAQRLQKTLETRFPDLALHRFTPEMIKPQDWVAKSQQGLAPVRAGRFLIHGRHDRKGHNLAGHHRTALRGFRDRIEIDAAQAFGTGHHGTTCGCLLALEQLARASSRPRIRKIFDLGTGTGILAIASTRLFQASVLAADIDPVAVAIARHNARLNGAHGCLGRLGRLRIVAAAGFEQPIIRTAMPFDLIIANVLAAPLKTLAPAFRQATHLGSYLVLSGLTRCQTRGLLARFRNFGFIPMATYNLDDWTTLTLKRRD